jgi:UDP-2-acetamido-2-deoxy-ribo-hexuluronate aminotransferase
MKKIQMVDLQGQLEPIKSDVLNRFETILEEASFINGGAVSQFQKELETYLGVKNVIPCANGTDALQIAMMGLGLKPGDEVITADFTFAATVEVIALLGLTPVLVDVYEDDFTINIEAVRAAITSKTKAIVPVHLFGQCANMDELMELSKEHDLFVIEDNAQAIGAKYHSKTGARPMAGTIGHVGATSFFPSKNLGAYGDGGALFTNDDDLAHTLRGIVNHGMYQRYHHDVVGVNSRLDSLQAAVLSAKLPHLDDYNHRRRSAARAYNRALSNTPFVRLPVTVTDCEGICESCTCHVFHQYTLKISGGHRDALAAHLVEKQIPHGVYYPIPLHKQRAYSDQRYREEDFSVTNRISDEVLSLPMHTELTDEQIGFITATIHEFLSHRE